ncbi:TonB-dependent receptor [Membranihabitans marinus]
MQLQVSQVYAGSLPQEDEVLLTEAIQSIGRKYQVLFSYDRSFVKEVRVDYDEDATDNLEDALKSILSQTNLKYQIFDQRYVAVYRDSDEGLASLQKMIEHFQGIVDQRQKIRKRKVNSLTPLDTYSAQEIYNKRLVINVSGIVTNATGEPLIGVNVIVKGTDKGTATDFDGRFILNDVDENAILLLSYIGYQSKEIAVNGNSEIVIVLEEDSKTLDEVVVVGYGTMLKSDLTSAISKMDGSTLNKRVATRLDEALQGQLSGVSIQQGSGIPGAPPLIRIRGISSITSGNSPLFVIDGFPVEDSNIIGNLNMNDVESIEVMKDAASASIYGSRGANGVIVITTKRGEIGKPTISFSSYSGFQNPEKLIDFMDGNDVGEMVTESRNELWVLEGGNINDPNDIRPPNRRIDPQWISGNQPTYDYQDFVFHTALIQNHSFSLNGGVENTKYFISLDYMNQDGIVKGTNFNRYSFRTNVESQLTSRIKVGLNMSPSYSIQVDRQTEGKDNTLNRIMLASSLTPFEDYYDPTTQRVQNDYANYYALEKAREWYFEFTEVPDKINTVQILTNAYLEVEILEGMTLRSTVGLLYNGMRRDRFFNLEAGIGTISAEKWNGSNTNWLLENTLNYSKAFKDHNISFLIGYTGQMDESRSNYMNGRGFANDLTPTLNNATLISNWDEEVNQWSLASMLSRINYNLKSRYLFSASIRRDGSSRFGKNTKYGVFPSISAGWKIHEEEFMSSISKISNLKLRISWGKTGNNKIGNYNTTANLKSSRSLLGEDETAYAGLLPANLGNQELGWEKTTSTNIGLDLGFYENRLNFTFDAYNNLTTDLLLRVPIPIVTGFSDQLRNLGEVRNRGIEIDINSHNVVGEFNWNTRFNLSVNQNEVLKMGPNGTPIINGNNFANVSYSGIGHPIGTFYMHVQEGIFQSQEEVDSSPLWGNEGVGDVKLKDVDQDGNLDNDDRDFLGQPFPKVMIGLTNNFSYKNFDLSIFMNGATGHKTFFAVGRYYDIGRTATITSFTANWNDRWKSFEKPGDGKTPKINSNATTNGKFATSRWLYDSDWFRIKNLTLGYFVPNKVINRIGIKSLRIYATADNLILFSKYPGYNPEGVSINGENVNNGAGYDYTSYPLSRRIIFGLNVNF